MDTKYAQLLLFFQIGMSLLVYALVARWYLAPALARRPIVQSLTPILLFHAMRHVGVVFLLPSVVDRNLPLSFSVPGAVGDVLAVFLALAALGALRSGSSLALPLLWIFNIAGTLDFANAIYQGLRIQLTDYYLGAAWFIPTVLVPAYIVSHVLVFGILIKRSHELRRSPPHQFTPA